MFHNSRSRVFFAALGFSLFAATAVAQISTKPLSDVGGSAGNELRRIYARDIGRGYTGDSLNAISMRSAQSRIPNVGQQSSPLGAPSSIGGAAYKPARNSKPFANVTSSPTVSPYMNLFREDLDGSSDFNYQTLVRPQLNQLQLNQQFQNQNTDLNRKVQSISAQRDYSNPAGSESVAPTGHQTTFGYHGRYYPGIGGQRQKQ